MELRKIVKDDILDTIVLEFIKNLNDELIFVTKDYKENAFLIYLPSGDVLSTYTGHLAFNKIKQYNQFKEEFEKREESDDYYPIYNLYGKEVYLLDEMFESPFNNGVIDEKAKLLSNCIENFVKNNLKLVI